MSNPITFSSSTPTIGLPLLFAGQSQKEFFVNQALTIVDSLYPRTVRASLPAPPADAAEGDCFRVTPTAAQAWKGCEDHLAIKVGGGWHFIGPREGLGVYDIAADSSLFFKTAWNASFRPNTPTNGATIDTEARTAITQLIDALQDIGILPQPMA